MAENYGVSRNVIFKQIHIVTDKLNEYERILQLKSKREKILKLLEENNIAIKDKIEDLL